MIPTTRPAPDAQLPVLSWREGGVVHVRFNRPGALNAIDIALARAFRATCDALAADPSVRVVVLSGEGRAFMAGGDLPAMVADPVDGSAALIGQLHPAIELLAALPATVIASVHGAVAGGGLGLALACDFIVAEQGTKFSVAYPRIGTSCDCATSWGLPRWVGLRKALELALLSDAIDADEALRIGLINRVVPTGSLAQETMALAARLAAGAPLALARIKKELRESDQNSLPAQLALEARLFAECAGSADFAEGMAAFLGRREAKFEGR